MEPDDKARHPPHAITQPCREIRQQTLQMHNASNSLYLRIASGDEPETRDHDRAHRRFRRSVKAAIRCIESLPSGRHNAVTKIRVYIIINQNHHEEDLAERKVEWRRLAQEVTALGLRVESLVQYVDDHGTQVDEEVGRDFSTLGWNVRLQP